MSVQDASTISSLAGQLVRDAMRPGMVTCLDDDDVSVVAATMVSHGIHAVLLGWGDAAAAPLIVTDRDLARAALEQPQATARDLSHEPVATVRADAALGEAVILMAERHVSHLLVLDPDSHAPVGVVSSFDVAAVASGQDPRYARMLRLGPARPSSSAIRLSQARAGDVMHPGVITCSADAPLTEVARCMAQHRVHCVAVAGVAHPDDQLTWGLIGDMDLIRAIHRGALTERASSIAATEPIAVAPDETLDRVTALMVEHDTSHIVVVGRSGLPAGMVSTRDVAAILAAGRAVK